jgi:hypothetical protein
MGNDTGSPLWVTRVDSTLQHVTARHVCSMILPCNRTYIFLPFHLPLRLHVCQGEDFHSNCAGLALTSVLQIGGHAHVSLPLAHARTCSEPGLQTGDNTTCAGTTSFLTRSCWVTRNLHEGARHVQPVNLRVTFKVGDTSCDSRQARVGTAKTHRHSPFEDRACSVGTQLKCCP